MLAAGLEQRLDLLRAFGQLDEQWRAPLERAVEALSADTQHRSVCGTTSPTAQNEHLSALDSHSHSIPTPIPSLIPNPTYVSPFASHSDGNGSGNGVGLRFLSEDLAMPAQKRLCLAIGDIVLKAPPKATVIEIAKSLAQSIPPSSHIALKDFGVRRDYNMFDSWSCHAAIDTRSPA